jgi:hypothetical protein
MNAPNPDFAAVTRRFIMEMPIAAHFGFALTDIRPGYLEVTQPYRRELSFREGMFQAGAVGTIADFAGAGACVTMLPEGWGGDGRLYDQAAGAGRRRKAGGAWPADPVRPHPVGRGGGCLLGPRWAGDVVCDSIGHGAHISEKLVAIEQECREYGNDKRTGRRCRTNGMRPAVSVIELQHPRSILFRHPVSLQE